MNISIIGTGYLGLTTASVLASSGYKVYAVDINADIVAKIKTGKPHFFETGLEELVEKAVREGNLVPTLDYVESVANSDISFICVNTPGLPNGGLNISAVKSAVKSIVENMRDGHIIVMKSTVPVGTHIEIKKMISEMTDKKFTYVSKPEFLAENSAVFDTLMPDRIIIGTEDDRAFEVIFSIFENVDKYAHTLDLSKFTTYSKIYRQKFESTKPFGERVIRVKTASAELVKVAANSFLATKISYANSISRLTDEIGADVNEVFEGLGADPRIGRDFFYAGLGWGGGCFPKDLQGLVHDAETHGFDFGILKEVYKLNEEQVEFVKNKAIAILGENYPQATVTILGLAFKPGTDDVRISPAIKLVRALAPHVRSVNIFDPKAIETSKKEIWDITNIRYCKDIPDAVDQTHLVVLATDWPEFTNLDFANMRKTVAEPNLLDARNRWDKTLAEEAGFKYFGIGR